jgi:hypothetical protein
MHAFFYHNVSVLLSNEVEYLIGATGACFNIKSIFSNVFETKEVASGLRGINGRFKFKNSASGQGKSGRAMTFFKLVIAHDGGDSSF